MHRAERQAWDEVTSRLRRGWSGAGQGPAMGLGHREICEGKGRIHAVRQALGLLSTYLI